MFKAMNKVFIILIISIIILSCEKDEGCDIRFKPTNFIVGSMGPEMFFGIKMPSGDYFGFSADSTKLTAIGDQYHEYLLQRNELYDLVQDLSDTLIFKWEFITAVSPFPEDECELHAAQMEFGSFMCSIGKGKNASCIMVELSNSMSGDAKNALMEIAEYLSH